MNTQNIINATFENVKAGDLIILDGIFFKITKVQPGAMPHRVSLSGKVDTSSSGNVARAKDKGLSTDFAQTRNKTDKCKIVK